VFEQEKEFMDSYTIADDVTKRALLYALQVCVDVVMDVAAMTTKDLGLAVEDDYTNIEKLEREKVLASEEAELIRTKTGYLG